MGLGDFAKFAGGALYAGGKMFYDQGSKMLNPGQDIPAWGGKENLADYGTDPNSSALSSMLSNMKAPGEISPTAINYTGEAYKGKDYTNASLPEYDAMRNRLNQNYSQQQGIAQDALDRQFAAMGGGPGNGAQAKQTENLATAVEKQKGQDLEGINAQEMAAKRQLQEQEANKEFTSGENQKQNQFQAQIANSQQALSAKEFNAQMGTMFSQFQFEGSAKIAGLDDAWRQAQAENKNNQFNAALSSYQAQHSGGLLGGGGLLGTGL